MIDHLKILIIKFIELGECNQTMAKCLIKHSPDNIEFRRMAKELDTCAIQLFSLADELKYLL